MDCLFADYFAVARELLQHLGISDGFPSFAASSACCQLSQELSHLWQLLEYWIWLAFLRPQHFSPSISDCIDSLSETSERKYVLFLSDYLSFPFPVSTAIIINLGHLSSNRVLSVSDVVKPDGASVDCFLSPQDQIK